MDQTATPRFGLLRSLVTDLSMHVEPIGPSGPTENAMSLEFFWPSVTDDGNVSAALKTTLTMTDADEPHTERAKLSVKVSGAFADPDAQGAALAHDREFVSAALEALYQQARVHLSAMAGASPMMHVNTDAIDADAIAADLVRAREAADPKEQQM